MCVSLTAPLCSESRVMIRRCNVGAWRAQQRMATNTRKRSGSLTMSCPDPRTSVDVSHKGTDTRSHANAVKSRERLRKGRRRGRARLDAQKPRAVRSTRCAPLVGLARVATRGSAACRASTRRARGKKGCGAGEEARASGHGGDVCARTGRATTSCDTPCPMGHFMPHARGPKCVRGSQAT